jgi:hypothetical protein
MYILKLHKTLTPEKWQKYAKERQLMMIANEINRLINAIEANQSKAVIDETFERSFELIDLTIENQKNSLRKEILRWRDLFSAFYLMNSYLLKNSIINLKQLFRVFLTLNKSTAELL